MCVTGAKLTCTQRQVGQSTSGSTSSLPGTLQTPRNVASSFLLRGLQVCQKEKKNRPAPGREVRWGESLQTRWPSAAGVCRYRPASWAKSLSDKQALCALLERCLHCRCLLPPPTSQILCSPCNPPITWLFLSLHGSVLSCPALEQNRLAVRPPGEPFLSSVRILGWLVHCAFILERRKKDGRKTTREIANY